MPDTLEDVKKQFPPGSTLHFYKGKGGEATQAFVKAHTQPARGQPICQGCGWTGDGGHQKPRAPGEESIILVMETTNMGDGVIYKSAVYYAE